MSNENQETIADIVVQLRAAAHIQNADSPRDVLKFADRIEAAAKRERESEAEASHKREVAELRECLEQAYGDKIGTYTMKGDEVERWSNALREEGGAK